MRAIKKYQSGFLTIEILLAMAVMIFSLSAAVLMAFGGQSLEAGAAQNSEALNLAKEMLEQQRLLAANDFRLVNATSTQEGGFNAKVEVASHSFFTKKVNVAVDWSVGQKPQKIELQTLISDYGGTAGNDTCDSNLTGGWTNPQIKKVINFSDFFESGDSAYAIGAVDAYKEKLYIAMAKTGAKTDSTFFIFDISDPLLPALLSMIDNAPTTIDGFGALAINDNYAYLANNHASNFGTCSQNYNCAQLQIINLNSMAITNFKLPNITDDGGQGNSVFYRNNLIYLGLAKTDGAEFNIINASDPNNPALISGFEIDAGVNDIYVRGDYAYLAHPANLVSAYESGREQLTILNISNPANPFRVGGFYYDKGSFNASGKSLYLVGDNVYLGRTRSHISGIADEIPDFFILDNSDPESGAMEILGSRAFSEVASANGILVRDYLAFIAAGTQSQGGGLKIFDISDITNIAELPVLPFPNNGTGVGGAALDCEGNYLYAASIDGEGKSYISIIGAD